MKKFLSKLPVMISFWCITVILLIITIVFAARPVSYGWKYKGQGDVLDLGQNTKLEAKFKNSKEIDLHVEMDAMTMDMGMWYVRNGKKISVVAISYVPSMVASQFDTMTETEFEQEVKDAKADRQRWREIWAEADSVNAFTAKVQGEKFVCSGAIAFVTVTSILSAAVLTFATLSTIMFIKSKKQKPEQDQPKQVEQETTASV